MDTLALKNPLLFSPSKKRQSRRKHPKSEIEQLGLSQEKTLTDKTKEYFANYFPRLTSEQSLSVEQIAKANNEKIIALSSKYKNIEIEKVRRFISTHSFLIPLLEEIPNQIYQYFGNEQILSLEVSFEEDFPQSSELWVLILTELPAKEARSIMDKFDKDWWLGNLGRAKCKLNIGIEYV